MGVSIWGAVRLRSMDEWAPGPQQGGGGGTFGEKKE